MDSPTIRPGAAAAETVEPNLFAFFHNAAGGNAAIQLLTAMGVADDQLGVTPPEKMGGGQGLLLAMVCPIPLRAKVEAAQIAKNNAVAAPAPRHAPTIPQSAGAGAPGGGHQDPFADPGRMGHQDQPPRL